MGQGMSKRRISAVVAGACTVLMTVSLVTPVTPPAHADSSAPDASDSVASVDRHTVSADRSPAMRERDPHGNPLPAAQRPDAKYPRGVRALRRCHRILLPLPRLPGRLCR